MDEDDDDVAPHEPRNRSVAASKLRRSRTHCPVCLAALVKNQRRTRRMRKCVVCEAGPQPLKVCRRCGAEEIWQGKSGVACQSCGLHGTKEDVIAT